MKHLVLAFCMIFLLVSTLGIATEKDAQKETKTFILSVTTRERR